MLARARRGASNYPARHTSVPDFMILQPGLGHYPVMQVRWVGAFVLLFASPAAAAEPLAYHADDGCPDRDAFVAAVEKRGASLSSAGDRSLDVDVRRDGDEFVGRLIVRRGTQASAPRDVRGKACSEVVEALAVAAAIGLKDTGTDDTPSPPEASTPAPPVAHPVLEEDRLFGVRSTDVPAGKLRFTPIFGVTVLGGIATGILPGVLLPRYDLVLTRANMVTAPDDRRFFLAPVFRMVFSYFGQGTYRTVDASVQAQGVSFGAGVCTPMFYADTHGLTLLVCGQFTAGATQYKVHDGTGREISSKSTPTGTVGVDLEAQYAFGHFHVGAKAGLASFPAPLIATGPRGDELVHASLTANFTVGAGAHF